MESPWDCSMIVPIYPWGLGVLLALWVFFLKSAWIRPSMLLMLLPGFLGISRITTRDSQSRACQA